MKPPLSLTHARCTAQRYANGVFVGRHIGYLEPLEMKLPTAALWPRRSSSTSDITTRSDDPNDGAGHTDKGPWVETLVLAIAVDGGWNRTEDPLWGAGTFWNQVRASYMVTHVPWTKHRTL
jgi:hypothetical protein